MHCFQNTGNVNAKFLIVAAPAGLEKFFEEGFYPAAEWPNAMPPMNDEFMDRVIAAATKCDLIFFPRHSETGSSLNALQTFILGLEHWAF